MGGFLRGFLRGFLYNGVPAGQSSTRDPEGDRLSRSE